MGKPPNLLAMDVQQEHTPIKMLKFLAKMIAILDLSLLLIRQNVFFAIKDNIKIRMTNQLAKLVERENTVATWVRILVQFAIKVNTKTRLEKIRVAHVEQDRNPRKPKRRASLLVHMKLFLLNAQVATARMWLVDNTLQQRLTATRLPLRLNGMILQLLLQLLGMN
jgi:hypothetical protein